MAGDRSSLCVGITGGAGPRALSGTRQEAVERTPELPITGVGAVIFDMDGPLTDTSSISRADPCHTHVDQRARWSISLCIHLPLGSCDDIGHAHA